METRNQRIITGPKNVAALADENLVKKPYATPHLIVHGTVADITSTPGGANTDGTGGSHGPP